MATILQRIIGRITETLTTQTNALSRQLRVSSFAWARRIRSSLMQPTKDWNRSDYAFYKNAYYLSLITINYYWRTI